MSLPKSVQAQADRAAKHFEPKPEKPEAQPPADPALEQDRNPQSEPSAPDEPKPEEIAQPAEETAKSEPKAESDDALYWQHRFNVLQGKYNGEIKALREESSGLRQQVADKDRRIQELEQQSPGADNSGVSDDQLTRFKAEFGEDLVSFVERMVSQQAAPAANPDDSKVQQLDERLSRFEQEQQQDAQARFWVALERAVPTYREVNSDPKFHEFLAQFDAQTGKQRQQALTEAQQALDAKGVADVFQLFLEQAGQQASSAKPKVPDEQVEPRTTRVTDAPQGKRRWSRAEISQFYRDKTAGRYGAEEAERLEADIFAAQSEGRVY